MTKVRIIRLAYTVTIPPHFVSEFINVSTVLRIYVYLILAIRQINEAECRNAINHPSKLIRLHCLALFQFNRRLFSDIFAAEFFFRTLGGVNKFLRIIICSDKMV